MTFLEEMGKFFFVVGLGLVIDLIYFLILLVPFGELHLQVLLILWNRVTLNLK